MSRNKIRSETEQRKFTIVYNDFLESELLDKHEKLIFIAIKKFADNDTLKAFPSLRKLSKITGISVNWIKKSIDHMQKIGVLSIEHRVDAKKGNQSNVYTLYDFKEIWNAGSSEEIENIKKNNFVNLSEVSTEILLKELNRRKGKELESEQVKAQNQALEDKQFYKTNNTMNTNESQDDKEFSRQEINNRYNFNILVENNQYNISLLDAIFELLLELLNTTLSTIRVNRENRATKEVKDRLLKLNYMHIQYVLDEVTKQSNIKDIRSYIITSLYNSYTTIDIHYNILVNEDN